MTIIASSNTELTVKFLTLFRYQPRNEDNSLIVKKSRDFKNNVKGWSILPTVLEKIDGIIKSEKLDTFFEGEITMVPIPSSSLKQEETLKPPLEICKLLYNARPNLQTADCLKRHKSIKKSSLGFTKSDRPSVQDHLDSINLNDIFISTNKILIVDDVLTTGTTAMACAKIVKSRYPESKIAVFSFLRPTQLDESISKKDKITQIICGTITLYNSQKTWISDGNSEPSWF
jgi:uracil phosphoribosyltransferase